MDVEIKPEPGPDEREAIELALRRLLTRGKLPHAYTSLWRREGLREALEDQVAVRPRRSLGATRA